MHRIKAYQQLEHSDCGITCIRIIAKYYGKEIPARYLRNMCDVGRLGMSLRDVRSCLHDIGFRAEAVRIGVGDIERMPLPAILYWDQRHYVVLYGVSGGGTRFRIADPSRGKVRLDREAFEKHWIPSGDKGLAIVMDPDETFCSREYEKDKGWGSGLWRMAKRVVKSHRMTFVAAVLLALVGVVADVVSPMLFQHTVDEGINGRDVPLVWMLVGAQFVVFFGNCVSSGIAEVLLAKAGLRIGVALMNEYLGKLIRLPASFFDRRVSSDFIQKVNDESRIKNFLLGMPETVFFTVVNLVVFSAMLIHYSLQVFVIFVLGTALSLLWTQLHLGRRKSIDYELFASYSENQNNLYELVNGMQEIRVNNAQDARVAVWNRTQEKINRQSVRSAMLNLSVNTGNAFIMRMKDVVITGLCATLVVRGSMTIGEMMTISYVVGRLAAPFSTIVGLGSTLQDVAISYERLEEIVRGGDGDTPSGHVDAAHAAIRFDGVSFKYPGSYSPFVIDDFTATIEHGKTTAIVGPSGCGKTTLAKLMLGFYVPQKGNLAIGSLDSADVDRDEWLHNCGVVMQSGYVFSGTILENIALAESSPDVEKVRAAARIACIDDFFSSLPMGYHTRLGNAGLELSGGQKQRLFIARAVYKSPRFLVLDEATSSLDANNESSIVRNLARFNEGRTVVVMAHRLSTVKHADKIIYVDKGRVVEEGTHDELVARRGAYYKLVREQLDR